MVRLDLFVTGREIMEKLAQEPEEFAEALIELSELSQREKERLHPSIVDHIGADAEEVANMLRELADVVEGVE